MQVLDELDVAGVPSSGRVGEKVGKRACSTCHEDLSCGGAEFCPGRQAIVDEKDQVCEVLDPSVRSIAVCLSERVQLLGEVLSPIDRFDRDGRKTGKTKRARKAEQLGMNDVVVASDDINDDPFEGTAVQASIDTNTPYRASRVDDAEEPHRFETEFKEIALRILRKRFGELVAQRSFVVQLRPHRQVDVTRRSRPVGESELQRDTAFEDPGVRVSQSESDEEALESN